MSATGCGWEQGSGHYHLQIEDGFSPSEVNLIHNAAELWQYDTNETVRFYDYACPDCDVMLFEASTLKKLTNEVNPDTGLIAGYTTYIGSSENIQLVTDLDVPQFYHVAEHEIGHGLGLKHEPGGVMEPHTWAHYIITCEDVKRFCNVWDCDFSKTQRCQESPDITAVDQWDDSYLFSK